MAEAAFDDFAEISLDAVRQLTQAKARIDELEKDLAIADLTIEQLRRGTKPLLNGEGI